MCILTQELVKFLVEDPVKKMTIIVLFNNVVSDKHQAIA